MKYGYVRISTREQHEDRQLKALKDIGVSISHIYTEKSMDRPAWNELLGKISPEDTIVVMELDRLARNLMQIKNTYELLGKLSDCIKLTELSKSNIVTNKKKGGV